jgi:hypothetical protein
VQAVHGYVVGTSSERGPVQVRESLRARDYRGAVIGWVEYGDGGALTRSQNDALCDIEAEQRIVVALIETIKWQTLEPMRSEWFYVPLHRAIVTRAQDIQRDGPHAAVEHVANVLRELGHSGHIETGLQFAIDNTPFLGVPALLDDRDRVHELFRARRLASCIEGYVVELRNELRTSGQVLESIARLREEFA